MSQQKKIFFLVISVLVVLSVGVVLYTKKTHVPATKENVPTEKGVATSLRVLLQSGATQKCTFSETIPNSSRSGTVYMATGRMRGDFSVPGGARSAHMITDGLEARFWSDSEIKGVVVRYRKEEQPLKQDSLQTLDIDAKIEYSCEAWKAEETLLQSPADIVFQTAESGIPDITATSSDLESTSSAEWIPSGVSLGDAGTASGTRSSQCRLCDRVTSSESKEQCIKAFKC